MVSTWLTPRAGRRSDLDLRGQTELDGWQQRASTIGLSVQLIEVKRRPASARRNLGKEGSVEAATRKSLQSSPQPHGVTITKLGDAPPRHWRGSCSGHRRHCALLVLDPRCKVPLPKPHQARLHSGMEPVTSARRPPPRNLGTHRPLFASALSPLSVTSNAGPGAFFSPQLPETNNNSNTRPTTNLYVTASGETNRTKRAHPQVFVAPEPTAQTLRE